MDACITDRSIVLRVVALWSAVGIGAGCATPELSGREILRVAPLRGEVVGVAAATSEADPTSWLAVGRDLVDDAELAPTATATMAAFSHAVGTPTRPPSLVVDGGRARLSLCRVQAGLGRNEVVIEARCRAQLELNGGVLVDVEGEARHRRPVPALTRGDVETAQARGKNPRVSAADVRTVLADAAREAARRLLVDDQRAARLPARAKRARQQLAQPSSSPAARVLALVDLARDGDATDAALVLPHLHDDSALVRHAAVSTLAELCPSDATLVLEPLLADAGLPADLVKRSQARLVACVALPPR